MLFIVGVIVLLVVAMVGVLSNAGAGHPLTDFSVFENCENAAAIVFYVQPVRSTP